ncbi:MAG: diguanylate cyclase [Deltaproteobacteria bacterium]|nr:diguanylate cyclase [Deltaproteobacteria bacterium]
MAAPEAPPHQICLVVDDSLTVRRGLKLALQKAGLFGEVLEADDGDTALTLVEERHVRGLPGVDLVLADLVMPRMDGFEFLAAFKRDPGRAMIPVIVLTGQESTKKKVRALDAGAADYLVKPFDNAELIARVRVHLKVKNLQDELRELNKRLQALSTVDAVTGLPNRPAFLETLDRELARARRHGTKVALLTIEIDHLWSFAAAHGKELADQALAELAALLKETLRKTDSLGRYSGTELVALLPETARVEAAAVGEKLRAVVAARPGAAEPHLTLSVGVACYPDQQVGDPRTLLRASELALQQSRQLGRNRVAMWMGELGIPASVAVQV